MPTHAYESAAAEHDIAMYPALIPEHLWHEIALKHGLTGRETVIAALICRGLSNVEISTLLGISPETLRTHTRSAYRKLGRRKRLDMVLWLVHRYLEPAKKAQLITAKARRVRSDGANSVPLRGS